MRDDEKFDDMALETLTKIVRLGVHLMMMGVFLINAPFVQLAAELSTRPASRTEVMRFLTSITGESVSTPDRLSRAEPYFFNQQQKIA